LIFNTQRPTLNVQVNGSGSTGGSPVGFGVSPKQSYTLKVHAGETPASTPGTDVLPRTLQIKIREIRVIGG
jgi:hypothetical protein